MERYERRHIIIIKDYEWFLEELEPEKTNNFFSFQEQNTKKKRLIFKRSELKQNINKYALKKNQIHNRYL